MKAKFLIIASFLWTNLLSQKSIVFIDNETKQPIDFLILYSKCNSGETFNTDHSGKIVIDTMKFKCSRFKIEHFNYVSTEFDFTYLLKTDTIKLAPVINILTEVVISSHRDPSKYWINVLNSISREYQKDTKYSKESYHYYLQTVNIEKEVVEKIKANLEISYSNDKGFSVENDYMKYGMFWFHSKTPFLNLNTEKLILGYSPFAKKRSNDMSILPFNGLKLSKKNCNILEINCEYCKQNEVCLELSFEDKIKCKVVLDTSTHKFRELQYNNINLSKSTVERLDNSNFPFDGCSLYYTFDSIGLFSIRARLQPMNSESKIEHIDIFLLKQKNGENINYLKVVGSYTPDNIYENIILSPVSEFSIDELDNSLMNSQHLINQDVYYSKNLNQVHSKKVFESILNLKKSSNRFKIWNNEDSLSCNDFYFIINNKGGKFNSFGDFVNLKSELEISWFIKVEKVNNEIMLSSLSSVWNATKSIYVGRSHDSIYFPLFSNLIFDFYESQRKILFDSLSNIKIHEKNLSIIFNLIDKRYKSTKIEVNNLLEIVQFSPILPLEVIDDLNKTNIKTLHSDRILAAFFKEFKYIQSNPKYHSIVDSYKAAAYRNIKNKELSNYYFNKTIPLYKYAILRFEKMPEHQHKRIAGLYALLSDSYLKLDDKVNGCMCLEKYKYLWPEGFAVSQNKVIYDNNCTK
jgi:hypothetical protein